MHPDPDTPPWATRARYGLLLVPLTLFAVSLHVPPNITFDSASGFLVLRSMLEGASFNTFLAPDPADLSADVVHFQTWWSPGQYLLPGCFILLGASYGLAISLTILCGSIVGALGWLRLSEAFGLKPRSATLFFLGLLTFRYATYAFRVYHGGELLLFAVAPWCVLWLRAAADRPFTHAFALALISALLLFFAKLTGLIVFAVTVTAVCLTRLARERRITTPVLGIAAAAALAGSLFHLLWSTRGTMPAMEAGPAYSLPVSLLFPITGTAFSGFSVLDFLSRLLLHPDTPLLSDIGAMSYVLGPAGLLLLVWIWTRLRATPLRDRTMEFGLIATGYTTAMCCLYLRGAAVSIDERHFRFAGILVLILLLGALEQLASRRVASIVTLLVASLAAYGVVSYAIGSRGIAQLSQHDALTGTSQHLVAPAVLAHLRAEQNRHGWKRAIAVLPSPEAAIALPGYRILAFNLDHTLLEHIAAGRHKGRAEKVLVVVQQRLIKNGKADALLRSFLDYPVDRWTQTRIGDITVYSQ